MSKFNYSNFCKVCEKEIYEDSPVCNNCKTNEFIMLWGNSFFDEEAISLEIVGEYPNHQRYWKEYQNKRV